MSQQEFVSGSQQNQPPENEEEIYAPQYPYSWSGKSKAEAEPRDEPPSSYEYEAGYQAQDTYDQNTYVNETPFDPANSYTPLAEQSQQAQQQYQNPYDANAYGRNAYGQDYNNYQAAQNNSYQNVPPYARPQPRSGGSPWRFSSILLILVLISIFSSVGRGFFFYGFHGLDMIFGLFPILILLLIFNGIRRGGRRRFRRGPWGW
jgi:hypothetical protein